MKIAFLSVLHNPFLGRLLGVFKQEGIGLAGVILDQKDISPRDQELFMDRTSGRLPARCLYDSVDNSLPFFFVTDHNSMGCVELVRGLDIDILVNAGTPRIIGKELLDAPNWGVVSCHPGLLPVFRGCSCVEWAIYQNKQVGNTVFLMGEGIDSGRIIDKEGLYFSKGDDYPAVRIKVYEHQHQLLARNIRKIIEQDLMSDSLPLEEGGKYYNVIDELKIGIVKNRLKMGQYAYQR